ncbi:unnamed protein product [Moneuplotes crassus]|uniref:Acyltransferase 3 domain-containing protein n=1 Tax=Euplotes crassus TaxID=5936 RepID=A0AAD1TZF5_EUPCR|nr:unnamed protein product [Moneuplotes crassus]
MRILTIAALMLLLCDVAFGNTSISSEEDTACLQHVRKALSPEGLGDLAQIALNSAKGPNELGDFDGCHADGLEYVILALMLEPQDISITRMGLCVPQECASQESFRGISDFVERQAKPYFPEDFKIVAKVSVSREVLSESMSTGAILVLIFTGFVGLLWFCGILITYTNIGSNGNFRSNKIEERKTTWALALHSWNPIFNLQKLFTVKEEGDKTLSVLNGVRVLSIGWVILGHSFAFLSISVVKNIQTLGVLFDSDFFSIVPGGIYAVDTFFFLSGFLTFALLISKMYPKKGMIGIVNTFLIYFHRYYRLIFPMIYIQLFTMFVMRYFGNGPMYRQSWDFLTKSCFANPWQNFVFIANLYLGGWLINASVGSGICCVTCSSSLSVLQLSLSIACTGRLGNCWYYYSFSYRCCQSESFHLFGIYQWMDNQQRKNMLKISSTSSLGPEWVLTLLEPCSGFLISRYLVVRSIRSYQALYLINSMPYLKALR